jgi:hypothetical protein
MGCDRDADQPLAAAIRLGAMNQYCNDYVPAKQGRGGRAARCPLHDLRPQLSRPVGTF